MRQLVLVVAVAALAANVVSCADTPIAPKAYVHISGTVLDRSGAGIQAVYLEFVEAGAYPDYGPPFIPVGAIFVHVVTDLHGNYVADVPEGDYRVWVIPPSSTSYTPTILEKKIRRGDRGFDYRFPYVRLATRPIITGGQSITDAYAFVRGQDYFIQVSMRQAGSELEAFVEPGTYTIRTSVAGLGFAYPEQQTELEVRADTTIDLTFDGNAVNALVTGPGGAPIPGAAIQARAPVYVSGVADASGTCVLYLHDGAYSFLAQAPDASIQYRLFPFVSIAGSVSLTFDLGGTQWSGVLRRNSDGSPLPGVRMTVKSLSYNERAYSQTDAGGTFHFVVRKDWAHTILIESGGLGEFDNVIAGADSTFDLVVPDPAALKLGRISANAPVTPTPPAAPNAPASAVVDPSSPRRSFHRAE